MPPGSKERQEETGLCLRMLTCGQVALTPGPVSASQWPHFSSASFPRGEASLWWKTSWGLLAVDLLTVSPLFVPSCVPFSIYMPWGEHCEHLSVKLGAFFGILFGALGALLLLGAVVFVALRFWSYPGSQYSYPLDSES